MTTASTPAKAMAMAILFFLLILIWFGRQVDRDSTQFQHFNYSNCKLDPAGLHESVELTLPDLRRALRRMVTTRINYQV
jgi:hypothetical protein